MSAIAELKLPPLAHPEERELWGTVARSMRPPQRRRPSDWAEKNVVLTREQSPQRPGPLSCDVYPWTRDSHDIMYDNPEKRGVICKKRAQLGLTRVALDVIGSYCEDRPGPFLFCISNNKQAAHYANEHFSPMVEGCPSLKALFDQAAEDDRRELTIERPYKGGRVDFVGAGSVSSVTSRTYVCVFLDEYEVFMDEFPSSAAGDGFTMAEARTLAVESIAQIWTWSHPRRSGQGIDKLYREKSDQRAWVFDCPHCFDPIFPHSSLMVFPVVDEMGLPDPTFAEFRCPHCGCTITDRERAKATWSPRLGGTGRFLSRLTPEEAAKKKFVGIEINGLADPFVTVASRAAGMIAATDERSLMAWHNVIMGEDFSSARAVITKDVLEARCAKVEAQISVPGGEKGCVLLTVGVDVQHPKDNPTLYVWASAWSIMGHRFVVDLLKVRGWAALNEYLQRLTIAVAGPDGRTAKLYPKCCSIDCGDLFAQVADHCREPVINAGGNRVLMLPVRFRAHVRADAPAILPAERKLYDPQRLWMGPLKRWDLYRHHWVDRLMSRWGDGRVTVLCKLPPEFFGHMQANVLSPVKDVHNWGSDATEWAKRNPRDRDDYAMAGAYDETGAVLECNLDRLYQIPGMIEGQRKQDEAARGDVDERFLERGIRTDRPWL